MVSKYINLEELMFSCKWSLDQCGIGIRELKVSKMLYIPTSIEALHARLYTAQPQEHIQINKSIIQLN